MTRGSEVVVFPADFWGLILAVLLTDIIAEIYKYVRHSIKVRGTH